MVDAHANFAVSTVATAPSPATSGTSLLVAAGQGSRFPAVPFNATICPANTQPDPLNAEIVRVTARTTDTLTIVRAQEGTTARSVLVGDAIFASITAKTLTDVEGGLTAPSLLVYIASSTLTAAQALGAKSLWVRCWGAGGGSGGTPANAASFASGSNGGGGGSYAESLLAIGAVTFPVTITVGAGGTAGVGATPSAGGNGGASSFAALVVAGGGLGGNAGLTGNAPGARANGAGTGGVATAGAVLVNGSDAQPGYQIAAGLVMAASGGAAAGGGGGVKRTAFSNQSDGAAGNPWGGGASGAISGSGGAAQNGAAGGSGLVLVELIY